jgi:DNA-binding transcriptional ArsR family regulator
MSRDFGTELDALKEELRQLQSQVRKQMGTPIHLPHMASKRGKAKKADAAKQTDAAQDVLSAESWEQLETLRDELVAYSLSNPTTGAVAYTGTFASGDDDSTRQSIWFSALSTDKLLALNDSHMVEKVLASIGNSQRLAILLALLKKPLTVNQLIEALGFNSTGQVYHHLKPLVSADIIKEEKGVYAVIPHRVQGIIMLLIGVWDLIDTQYTSGQWEEPSAS